MGNQQTQDSIENFEELNQDLILEIFSYLPPESGFLLRRVNKEWNQYLDIFPLNFFKIFVFRNIL
jgi:hypothetical protein